MAGRRRLEYASDPTGSGPYSYDTAGLLTNRTVGNRYTSITSRDGEGRPLSIATTVNVRVAIDRIAHLVGRRIARRCTHLIAADFTDSRVYSYANLSRRLTQEQLNLNASTTWTNNVYL